MKEITKEFIGSIFQHTNIKREYIEILENNHERYVQAFTSREHDPVNNYEMYEYMGDAELNNAIVWYFYKRFPQLRCGSEIGIMTRLKNLYVSTESFSELANKFNFLEYIRDADKPVQGIDIISRQTKILEDVFEAFIGLTKIIIEEEFGFPGLASQIVYDFIAPLFDEKEIILDANILFDSKSRLKELFDQQFVLREQFGQPIYKYDQQERRSILYFSKSPNISFSTSEGNTKQQKEKKSASLAIEYLKNKGFETEKRFALHCI